MKSITLVLISFLFIGCGGHDKADKKLTKILRDGDSIKCHKNATLAYMSGKMNIINLKDGWEITNNDTELSRKGTVYYDISYDCIAEY